MIVCHIKRAGRGDWQLVRAVRLRALTDAPDAFSTTFAEDEARGDADWQVRVADRTVAQFLAVSPAGDGLGMVVGAPHTGGTETAGLFGMWVAPESRGRGIGRALVQSVIDWARGEDYRRILLDVGDMNVPAIRLYESCGFLPTGVTGTLPPPRDDLLEHERELLLA